MKPATPYADRPEVRAEFCSCHYVWSQKPDGTIVRHELLWRDPKCRLHGNKKERSPF